MNRKRQLVAACAALATAALWLACYDSPPPYQPPPECETAADCRRRVGLGCGQNLCVEGNCELEIFEKSTSQYRGNCATTWCNADGQAVSEHDPGDAWDDGNPCTDDVCEEYTNVNRRRDPGPSPSGSGFCDGEGHLVACLVDEDCGDPMLTCTPYKTCIPLFCQNTILDRDLGESDVDCGGRCDPCRVESPCVNGGDCGAGVCGPDNKCARAECGDGVENGDESDVDCGYGCNLCPDGAKCFGKANCESIVCFAGICQPRSCEDGTRNGQEEGLDCGGDCAPCQ